MKKKILVTGVDLNYGGIEKSLVILLNNFNLDKYDVTLVLENKSGIFLHDINSKIKILEYKPSNFKINFLSKIFNLFKRMKWLIKYSKKFDVGIVFATYSLPGAFLVNALCKNKIYYIHSNYKYIYEDIGEYKKFFKNRKINNYNHIICVANEIKNDLVNVFPNLKDKVEVINNLVDYENIVKLSKEIIDIKYDDKNVFFIGRMDEESKRISKIFEVAKILNEYKFYLIGDGPDYKTYLNKIKNESIKNVYMLGAKKNPYPYINVANIILFTSKYEGFPVVYNEAIVLKKKIVTTVNVTDEIIDINSGFGIVVNDVNDIANSIKNMNMNKVKTIDFKKVNDCRLKKLEKLMEE